MGRLGGTMTALVVIIALLLLADLVYAGVVIAKQSSVHPASAAAQASLTRQRPAVSVTATICSANEPV